MSDNIDDDVVDVISCVTLWEGEERKFVSLEGEVSGTTSTQGENIKVREGNS